MAIEMGEYFQLRRKLNLSYSETEQALGADRVESLAKGRVPLTADDAAKLTTFAGQRERDRQESKKAESARLRSLFGR